MSESSKHELAVRMAELARALAGEQTLNALLDSVTSAAVELIPAVDTAGILLVKKGSQETNMKLIDVAQRVIETRHE